MESSPDSLVTLAQGLIASARSDWGFWAPIAAIVIGFLSLVYAALRLRSIHRNIAGLLREVRELRGVDDLAGEEFRREVVTHLRAAQLSLHHVAERLAALPAEVEVGSIQAEKLVVGRLGGREGVRPLAAFDGRDGGER
jgi:hypothetical protein